MTPDNRSRGLPIGDQELVDAAVAFEVDRRRDIASLAAARLSGFMNLVGQRALKDATVCKLLGIDEGQLFQLFTTGFDLSQAQVEVIDGLYAVGAAAMHESHKNPKDARARLNRRIPDLIKDPNDPSSPERSALEAIVQGDLEQVLSVMDRELGDFDYNNR
ncbi:MAG: hypothetical protein ABSD69_01570 [Candidatus Levyibacteriota bacterium]